MKKRTIALTLASLGIGAAISIRENYKIDISFIDILLKKLPSSFNNYRILQISDLHNTRFGKNQQYLLNKIRLCNPDIIVITGDLLDKLRTTSENMEPIKELMSTLVKTYPIYYVPGNHEGTSCVYPILREYLTTIGVHVLENEPCRITNALDSISICGIVDPKFYPQKDDKEEFLHDLKLLKEACAPFSILLSHRPERFPLYAACDFDLVYCGHAHGGQFRIPWIGSLYSPNQGFLPTLIEGVYQKKTTKMIVSRGLGNSRLPQRLNNHPQLILSVLKKA